MKTRSCYRDRGSNTLVVCLRSLTTFVVLCLYLSATIVSSRSLETVQSGSQGHLRESAVQGQRIVLGACWQTINEHGRCSGFYEHNATKAACCSGTLPHTGWTPYNIDTEIDYFQFVVIGKQAPGCQPCKTSCENVVCGKNRVCRLARGRPQCICDPDCSTIPNLITGPVCGFDSKTYRSQCSLIHYSCRHHEFIPVDYVGTCQYSCEDINCETGKNCMIDQNGLPHCAPCMVECPTEVDPKESVCGGDGRTYPSLCHLERETCLRGRSIRLAYRSPCQAEMSCANMTCGSSRCLMDEASSTPVCVPCNRPCRPGLSRASICGKDNVTYSSYCDMVRNSCSRGVVIDTQHYGPCGRLPRGDLVIHPTTELERVAE